MSGWDYKGLRSRLIGLYALFLHFGRMKKSLVMGHCR